MKTVEEIKKDFPLLENNMITYLDSGATSQKPIQVINRVQEFYERYNANPHRGAYNLSIEATEVYENTRKEIAKFINTRFPEEIIFSKNATESLNLIAYSYGMENIKQDDEIVLSIMEHHSNLVPWQKVAKAKGAKLNYMYINKDFELSEEEIKSKITDKTKIVGITHVSNVLGTINNIKEIIKYAHKKGAVVVVDLSQSIPHFEIDVQDLDCDFLSFSGHKMCGPTGVGALYGKYELLNAMEPIEFGGEMIDIVGEVTSTWKDAPYRFEAGTPVIAGAIGLGAAIDYLQAIGFDEIAQHEYELRRYALEKLEELGGITIFNKDAKTGIISFNIDGVHPHDAATIYDAEGVCVRAGHHCAQPLMGWLCQPATLRASFYLYNTKEEVDAFIEATRKGKEFFDGVFF